MIPEDLLAELREIAGMLEARTGQSQEWADWARGAAAEDLQVCSNWFAQAAADLRALIERAGE